MAVQCLQHLAAVERTVRLAWKCRADNKTNILTYFKLTWCIKTHASSILGRFPLLTLASEEREKPAARQSLEEPGLQLPGVSSILLSR